MTGPASRPVIRRSNHDSHRLRLPIGAAPPDQVYAAFVDPDRLLAWLPSSGMTERFEHFDARPEGSYRLPPPTPTPRGRASGKATTDTDLVEARSVDLVPGERVVQAVDFVSDDPALAPVPRSDLVAPSHERASEGADLDRAGLVLQIAAEALDEGDGKVGLVVLVDAADNFLGVPRSANLAMRIAGHSGLDRPASGTALRHCDQGQHREGARRRIHDRG